MSESGSQRIWAIYIDSEYIDHPSLYDVGYTVTDVEIDAEINKHGSMEFTVPMSNPRYEDAKTLGATVTALFGDEEIFRGRIAETTRDFYNNIDVYCEGQLAFFCDSMVQPFAYKGSVKDFLQFIINTHNACVDGKRTFHLGNVTVTDPDNNGILVRSSDSALSCWEIITSRLIEPLGGYLLVRKENETYYIDYLAELTNRNNQVVQFGTNLLNLDEHIDTEDIVTVLYPFGAKIGDDGENENGYDKYQEEPEGSGITLWHGNRVTVREANGGKMYVEDQAGVETWGKIWGTNVWDDVTLPTNLLQKAQQWLADRIKSTTEITLSAIDLHLIDVEMDDIRIGDLVRVKSTAHHMDQYMPCYKMHIEPGAPDKNEITLGMTTESLTKRIASMKEGT